MIVYYARTSTTEQKAGLGKRNARALRGLGPKEPKP